MRFYKNDLKLLGLSTSESKVLSAIYEGRDTPLRIATATKISRPTIYDTIKRLHGRGLVRSTIRNGKKYWVAAKNINLDERLFEVKKALFDFDEGVEEIKSKSDATITIHRGAEAIRSLLANIMKENRGRRLYGIQGDVVVIGWNNIFGIESTNELNRLIKKNEIIVEAILPEGWFGRQIKVLGKKWAEDFEGRMSITHEIDKEYFDHGGQLFIFKDSLYLMAMNEEIIIEVRNSEIQKLILEMFRFMQDNAKKFDVNARLRELIVVAS